MRINLETNEHANIGRDYHLVKQGIHACRRRLENVSVICSANGHRASSAAEDAALFWKAETGNATPSSRADRIRMAAPQYNPLDVSELGRDVRCKWRRNDTRTVLRELAKLALLCQYDIHRLAAALGMSVRHLQRLFAHMGQRSPGGWLRQECLLAAKRQLRDASSVKEVAHTLGFRSASHFSRDFRRHFGMTPSTWMLQARAGARGSAPCGPEHARG